MKDHSYERIAPNLYTYDLETHKTQPGLALPPIVVGSACLPSGETHALNVEQCREYILGLLQSETAIIGGLNIAFDLAVSAQDFATRGIDLLPLIFAKYAREQVYDCGIAEQLHAIAQGHLLGDPRRGGAPLQDPITRKQCGYNLGMTTDLVLNRTNAKINAKWRTSYALLEKIPLKDWPPEAIAYILDDASNPREIALVQISGRNRNLHDLARQVFADFCLELADAQGLRCDPAVVSSLRARILKTRAEGIERFITDGLFILDEHGRPELTDKLNERVNSKLIKKLMADSYGVTGVCSQCAGAGIVAGRTKHKECEGVGCDVCGDGKIDNLKRKRCKTCNGRKADKPSCTTCMGSGKGELASTRQCPGCDTCGRDLSTAPIPRTEGGGIACGRDELTESGHELLIDWATFTEDDKIRTSYLPWMEEGIVAGKSIPMTLWCNVLLTTGRTSYNGLCQTMPRKGGVREAFTPPEWAYIIGADWSGVELVTHAQSCLWTLGYSKLAEMLNAGIGVHDMIGAQMSGIPYEEFLARRKSGEKLVVDYRQAAKPANFGFPGGMGAPRLVLQQRKADFNTTSASGKVYKGLRFCILVGGASECGTTKVTKWGRADLPPTCENCIRCAEELRDTWFQLFPENRKYFEAISQICDVGEIVQHHSGRIRGDISFCSAANTLFQGLAADVAKLALGRVTYECYVDRNSALYGSRPFMLMHDEILAYSPKHKAHEAALRLEEIMVGSLAEVCPDLAPACKAEPAIMRRLYKGAEAVYNEEGRLIPWEPS